MREEYEAIKHGCPWIQISYDPKTEPKCRAIRGINDDDCHYKNCAILYWLRNIYKEVAEDLKC